MGEVNSGNMGGNPGAYDETKIVVLELPEAIRKRPGMYVGSTGPDGLDHLMFDLVDHAVGEVTAGPGRSVAVALHRDGSATVRDDGPGLPVEAEERGKPALEAAMTRFYCRSGGPFGTGLPVLCALSAEVDVEVRRRGSLWRQRFARGLAASLLERLGPARDSGTSITFRPDPEIFPDPRLDADPIAARLSDLAVLNPEVRFEFRDERSGRDERWERRGGLADLVRDLNRGREPLHEVIAFHGRCGRSELRFAFQYHAGAGTDLRAFANQYPVDRRDEFAPGPRGSLRLGRRSSHVAGFLRALRRSLGSGPRMGGGADLLVGLTAAVSAQLEDPTYAGACRDRLYNPEFEPVAFSVAFLRLFAHFEEHPEVAARIRAKVAR